MRTHELNEEVLIADGPLVDLTRADVAQLKELALKNLRRRIRVCAHPDSKNSLHEMLIVHTRGAYIRPHKHLGKSESVHVVEGEADVVFFDESGVVDEHIAIGPYESNRPFYYRIEDPLFHTLLVASDFLVMHEVTNGPFDRNETVFAPWAPEEDDVEAIDAFQQRVAALVLGRTT